MREASNQKTKKERSRRLTASILSKAVPTSNSKFHSNRHLEDGDDANNNAGDDGAAYADYGFEIESYSLKYAGCSAIATFSDDLAEDEDSTTVFEKDQFVIFRLCPSDTCSDGSTYGCMYDYGEYMLPLEDWLGIMDNFRQEELERYCDYCYACVGAQDTDDNNNGGGGNDYYYENRGDKYYNNGQVDDNAGDDAAGDDAAGDDAAGDDANGDDAAGDDAAGDDANGDDAAAADNGDDAGDRRRLDDGGQYDCSYSNKCSGYYDICNPSDDAIDWSNFFNCRELDVNDDVVLYVGPHCASDKSTIILAAYSDQYCTEYVGDNYDISTITDQLFSADSLEEYYRSDCISCQESSLPFQKANGDDDNDDISEVCENLYGYAAKCNRHIGGATDESYQSYQQADNEYAVCSFIHSVVTGSYDEYGYIYIDSNSFAKDNKYNEYAELAIRRDVVTVGQGFGLALFSFFILGLLGWAVVLRKQVIRRGAFNGSTKDPLSGNEVSRQNSGIMFSRSKSNGSYVAPGGHMA